MSQNDSTQGSNFSEVFWYVPKTELEEAKRNFDRYLELVLRIYERITQEPAAYHRLLEELRCWDEPPSEKD